MSKALIGTGAGISLGIFVHDWIQGTAFSQWVLAYVVSAVLFVFALLTVERKLAGKSDATPYLALLPLILAPLRHIVNLPVGGFGHLPSGMLLLASLSTLVAWKWAIINPVWKLNARRWLAIIILGYVVIFGSLAVAKHLSFNSTSYDLGIYTQGMRKLSQGLGNFNTVMELPLFGDHIQPVLLLFIPFFAVFPSPLTLILLQVLVIASAAFPLYHLAKQKLGPDVALIPVAALFLHPPIQYITLFDFHPEVVAIPAFLAAFYFLSKNRLWASSAFLLLGGAAKEYFPAIVFMFGVYALIRKKRIAYSMTLMGCSLLWLYLNLGVLIPHFLGQYYYLKAAQGLGTSFGEIARNLLTHPGLILTRLLSMDFMALMALLLLPLGLLPLLGWDVLLIAAPTFAILGLLNLSGVREIVYHHTTEAIPLLFASMTVGLARLKGIMQRAMPAFVLCASVIAMCIYGPFAILYDLQEFNPVSVYAKNGKEIVSLVPEEAAVAAPNWILPHLSERTHAFELGHVIDNSKGLYEGGQLGLPDYIVLDLSDARHDPKRGSSRLTDAQVRKLLEDPRYGIVEQRGTWLLFKRGSPHDPCAIPAPLRQGLIDCLGG